jgi:inorganic pyrophosphatase
MIVRDLFADVPTGTNLPSVVNAIVEIPRGRRSKFEIDKATGLFKLDRYLFTSSHYPGDYGFIPQTLAQDGDALDILIMVNEPTFSGCLIESRVIGLFKMSDRGKNDYKVLGVPNADPLFAEYRSLANVPAHFLLEVEHFFSTYKQLEQASVIPEGWGPAEEAIAEVVASASRFRDTARRSPHQSSGREPGNP